MKSRCSRKQLMERMLIQRGKPRIYWGWVVATGGFLTQVILLTGSSILPLVLVTVQGELNISNADAGLIISMYGVLYVVGAIVLGAVADKLGLRKTLTLSSIIVSFGILSMSAANSLITCMIAYAIIGFGSAALITLIPKLTGSWFEIKRRGLASSYITSGGAASAAILGIIVPILAISYSWRAPFYILGFVSFLVCVLFFAMVKHKTFETELTVAKPLHNPVKGKEEQVKAKDVLKKKVTWHLAALNIIFHSSVLSISAFLVAYLIETGVPTIEAGVGFSVFMLTILFGQYLWGALSDYVPRKFILTTCACLLAVSTYIFVTFRVDQLITYLEIGILGVACGSTPVLFAVISDCFNPKVVGTAAGAIVSIVGVGSIVAPLIAGYLATATGTLASVFQLCIIMAAASAFIALLLKREPKHHS